MASPELTGQTGSVTLPPGMGGKVTNFRLRPNFRWKDNEGFADAGFQTGKLTGQGISGTVTLHVNTGGLLMATQQEAVAMVFQSTTGRTITGNFDLTDGELVVATGEIQVYTFNVRSNGTYTDTI